MHRFLSRIKKEMAGFVLFLVYLDGDRRGERDLDFEEQLERVIDSPEQRKQMRNGLIEMARSGVSPSEDFTKFAYIAAHGLEQVELGVYLEQRGVLTTQRHRKVGMLMIEEANIPPDQARQLLQAFFCEGIYHHPRGGWMPVVHSGIGDIHIFPGWRNIQELASTLTDKQLSAEFGHQGSLVAAVARRNAHKYLD